MIASYIALHLCVALQIFQRFALCTESPCRRGLTTSIELEFDSHSQARFWEIKERFQTGFSCCHVGLALGFGVEFASRFLSLAKFHLLADYAFGSLTVKSL